VGYGQELLGDRTTYRAFRWTGKEGLESLGAFRGSISRSSAWGVSDDGKWACGMSAGGLQYATRFSDNLIEAIRKSYGVQTFEALGISGDGQTLVGYQGVSDALWKAFRWNPVTGTKSLDSLETYPLDMATAVSRDGSIVAGWCKLTIDFTSYSYAVWWDESGRVHRIPSPLGVEPGSRAVDIDDEGRQVLCWGVLFGGRQTQVFVHDRVSGHNRLLPARPGSWFVPTGSCPKATVIVGNEWSGQSSEAGVSVFSRPPEALAGLLTRTGSTDHAGWTLTEVRAVTVADGWVTVVGHGTDPEGKIQAYRARIPLTRLLRSSARP
jgi:uncharacterized membrane protein